MDCSPPGSSVRRILQQEYWSELPGPPPGDLPDPVIEPMSLTSPELLGGFFTTSTTWEAHPGSPKTLVLSLTGVGRTRLSQGTKSREAPPGCPVQRRVTQAALGKPKLPETEHHSFLLGEDESISTRRRIDEYNLPHVNQTKSDIYRRGNGS